MELCFPIKVEGQGIYLPVSCDCEEVLVRG
jgi:hypothetical protein